MKAIHVTEPQIAASRALARAHREPPSRLMDRPRFTGCTVGVTESEEHWANSFYYGMVRRYPSGFPIGGGPYAVLSITALDETARHDWRDFQQLKNMIVGEEWEAYEKYPAESDLVDPSNRFYLWCCPKGTTGIDLGTGRNVVGPNEAIAPQRPFPKDRRESP